jgi:hypothetical protein
MKKIIIASLFIMINSVFTSCTTDEMPTSSNSQLIDSGGQSGELPTNPPKP